MNQISREDILELDEDYAVKKIRLVFLTYSEKPDMDNRTVNFEEGVIRSIRADGYDTCLTSEASKNGSCDTPHGRLGTKVVWERETETKEHKFHVKWRIVYQ